MVSEKPADADADEPTFGPLTDGDLERLSDLITRMSDDRGMRLRDKSAAYYRWMYRRNPAGEAIVTSAHLGDRLVASFAVAPKRFSIGGRPALLGKTMDMFTDPGQQGRGLITRCTSAVFADASAAGMEGWYVTPSPNSYPIFTDRWDYQEPFAIMFRARILRFAPVLGAVLRPARLGRALGRAVDIVAGIRPRRPSTGAAHDVSPLQSFDAEVDQLWAEIGPGYPVAQVRDSGYLTWRYLANPDHYTVLGLRSQGRLRGVVVLAETLRRGVKVTEVVDFLCGADDEDTFTALIDSAVRHARASGCALIQAWSIEGTTLDARIRRSGLRLRRSEVKFLLSPQLDDPLLADPENWLLTQGDGNDV